ncbi:sulfatase-like hydrolase/transferase [Candidatus Poribacteria bacterium]|nr:sulfatase-like hydrolase/transferase [Candidatus Poribacteria bacterium]
MSKPNVIWIYCDELRADAIGCYGNQHADMKTPNLDQLADSGVIFSNCFCNSPVCVSSRMSVLTGLYPEDTGVYHNEGHWPNFRLNGEYLTFPQVFAENGYDTADFGKLHIPREMQPWQYRNSEGAGMGKLYEDIDREDLDIINSGDVPTVIGGHYPADKPYPPEKLTENAINWIETAQEPYLVRLSYLQPHTPVFPRPPYDTMYQGISFPDVIEHRGTPSQFERRFAQVINAEKMTSRQIYLAQVYYYGLVSWIDSQIGQVLEQLRRTNQLENTIIVFGADHGASLGENGLYAKHVFAPQVHRVPLIISWPGTIGGGKIEDGICEPLSMARTLFNLTGIDSPAQFKGRDLIADDSSEAIYSTIGFGYPDSAAFPNLNFGKYYDNKGWPRRSCIRTSEYRLDRNVRIDGKIISYDEKDIFLADLKNDPDEIINVANKEGYGEITTRLSGMLDEHIKTRIEPPADYLRR